MNEEFELVTVKKKMDPRLKEVFLATLEGYEKQYADIYETCIPRVWSGIKEEEMETIYKKALEEGKTWWEVVGYEPMPPEALL